MVAKANFKFRRRSGFSPPPSRLDLALLKSMRNPPVIGLRKTTSRTETSQNLRYRKWGGSSVRQINGIDMNISAWMSLLSLPHSLSKLCALTVCD